MPKEVSAVILLFSENRSRIQKRKALPELHIWLQFIVYIILYRSLKERPLCRILTGLPIGDAEMAPSVTFVNLLAPTLSFLASTEGIGYKMTAWIVQHAIMPTPTARNFAAHAAANWNRSAPVAGHPIRRIINFAGSAGPVWPFPAPLPLRPPA